MKQYSKRSKNVSAAKKRNNMTHKVGDANVKNGAYEIYQQDVLSALFSRRLYNVFCPQCRLQTGRRIVLAKRADLSEHLLDHKIHRALGDELEWIKDRVNTRGTFSMRQEQTATK